MVLLPKIKKTTKELEKELKARDEKISNLEKNLYECEQTARAKAELMSITAHELRTPLAGIKWTISMFLKGDMGPLTEEQKNFLKKADESNDKMVSLIGSLLNKQKLEGKGFQYDFVPLHIDELARSIVNDLALAAEKKAVSVDFKEVRNPLPEILGDAVRLRAALQDLIENAIKYSNQGGKVEVEAKLEGEYVLISISDHGIGIPKSEQRNIFQKSFRAGNAMAVEKEGSGLGLLMAKDIVEKHGGTIQFESEEGKGTKFFISLPIKKVV